jgi:hypothetical protein
MEGFGRIILLTLGLGLTAVAISFFPRHPVAAAPPTPSIPVNVTNTPLPVSGNVNANITNSSLAVTGNVNAAVGGTVGVNNFPPTLTGSTVPVSGAVSANVTFPSSLSVYDLDDRGRTAYQVVDSMAGQCPATFTGTPCTFTFATVPSGYRLVVQHVSGLVQFTSVPQYVEVLVNLPTGSPASEFFAPFNTYAITTVSEFDQQVLVYYDQGQTPFVQVNAVAAGFSGGNSTQQISLSGYLLNCLAVACQPIAQ